VNLKHSFFAAQAVLEDMKAAKAWRPTRQASPVCSVSPARWRVYGPRVNAVAPGWIMTQRQIEKWLTPEGEEKPMRRQCLKRKLVPDEIAKFVVFLASDEASACTSQHDVVDGGWV